MGEQVAGAAGYGWLDGVRADLEREGYASRGADLPALAVNAPHIRQRLYWVACDMGNANDARLEGRGGAQRDEQRADGQVEPCSVHDHMADADQGGRGRRPCDGDGERNRQAGGRVEDHGVAAGGGEDRIDVADAQSRRNMRSNEQTGVFSKLTQRGQGYRSFWSDHIWLTGADGKSRRSKPGLPLLANGVPARVGKLRAYGNAICAPLAAEVISAFMESV